MTKKPHWTDKYITKQTLGAWSHVPGNEVTEDLQAEVIRRGLVRRWLREHRLAVLVVTMFVLPILLYVIGHAASVRSGLLLLVTFLPSIVLGLILRNV